MRDMRKEDHCKQTCHTRQRSRADFGNNAGKIPSEASSLGRKRIKLGLIAKETTRMLFKDIFVQVGQSPSLPKFCEVWLKTIFEAKETKRKAFF